MQRKDEKLWSVIFFRHKLRPLGAIDMAQKRVERRLTAILAADVAGYSRLMGIDEEGTLARLKAHRRELIDPKITKHHGRIVKTTGDGLLVEFTSVVDAARCVVEVQRAMVERNVTVPQEKRIEFRVGISVGDIIIDGGDIFGNGVNVAARLEGLAEPGGICVSGRVQEDTKDKLDVTFEDAGEQQLKNITRSVRVYRVRLDGVTKHPALALPDKPSIAVLPFNNLSGDQEQEYFADGIVEDIITALSRIKSFFVIARNSSFTYKGKTVDVKQVARELGVRYVLEGSVRKVGNKVRITGQLIDGTNGAHVWADNFDGMLEDIFDLQDRITASVVSSIEPNLQLAEIGRLKLKSPANFDAYDLLLRAQQLWYEFTEESITAALLCLKKALIIDPAYAPAMALTARFFAYRRLQGWTQDVTAETTEGIRLASRAVKLGEDDGQVLWWAANAFMLLGMDKDRARELIYRSLFMNPNSSHAMILAGLIETCVGNPAKALELLHRAERLNPRDPYGCFLSNNMAITHFVDGRYDEAVSWAQKSLAQNPRFAPPLRVLAASRAKLGEGDQAAKAVRDMLTLEPQLTLSKLRERLMYYDESVWKKMADGLRLAGLPE
jgi:TolB-like protein/class 3 adenylate cyclase